MNFNIFVHPFIPTHNKSHKKCRFSKMATLKYHAARNNSVTRAVSRIFQNLEQTLGMTSKKPCAIILLNLLLAACVAS